MVHGFDVYIDESGDEGFKFAAPLSPGSSEWFVLSAAVTLRSENALVVDMVRQARRITS